ncbi:MAG: GerAB/ArcD/ProY family transporter [Bacillota bacterium]
MLRREQIDGRQLVSLLLGFLLGTSLVLPTGHQAERDAWLAVLIGGGAGVVAGAAYARLSQAFPGQSLVGYSRRLLGRWVGGLIGLLYIWYALHLGSLVLRNIGDLVVTTILMRTPIIAPLVMMMALTAYAIRHGLETLARTSQVIVGLVLLQVASTFVFLVEEMRLERLLPVLDQGLAPVLKGGWDVFAFPFGETVLFGFVLQHLRPGTAVRRPFLVALTVGVLVLGLITVRNVSVSGAHVLGAVRFPSTGVIQRIEIGDILTRLEPGFIATWILTGFLKLSLCLYAATGGIAEWWGLSEYRPLVMPIGALMVALSILVYPNVTEMVDFATTIWPVYSFPFQVLIPLVLVVATWVRGAPKG